jgi:hypothetical protein
MIYNEILADKDFVGNDILLHPNHTRTKRKRMQPVYSRFMHLLDADFAFPGFQLGLAEAFYEHTFIAAAELSLFRELEVFDHFCLEENHGLEPKDLIKHFTVDIPAPKGTNSSPFESSPEARELELVRQALRSLGGLVQRDLERRAVEKFVEDLARNLEHLFQLNKGSRITLRLRFDLIDDVDGVSHTCHLFDKIFPVLQKLTNAGYRIYGSFPEYSLRTEWKYDAVLDGVTELEFSPEGWLAWVLSVQKARHESIARQLESYSGLT